MSGDGARPVAASARRLVLFDLDGTLLCGASSERRFAAWLFAHRHAGARQAGTWLAHAAGRVRCDGRHVLRRDKGYVAGLPVGRVAELAAEHVGGVVDAGRVDARAHAALEAHRAAGDRCVLLSGTLQPLADAYAARLGLDAAIGSLAPVRAGRYVVGPPARHPYGVAKRELAERERTASGAGRADTVAYGDSIADRDLLAWAGEAVAVEPDRALGSLARARGWRVLRHAREPAAVPDPGGAGRARAGRGTAAVDAGAAAAPLD